VGPEEKTSEERKDSNLRYCYLAVDEKLTAIDALERQRLRSRILTGALSLPPLGLGLGLLFRGNLPLTPFRSLFLPQSTTLMHIPPAV